MRLFFLQKESNLYKTESIYDYSSKGFGCIHKSRIEKVFDFLNCNIVWENTVFSTFIKIFHKTAEVFHKKISENRGIISETDFRNRQLRLCLRLHNYGCEYGYSNFITAIADVSANFHTNKLQLVILGKNIKFVIKFYCWFLM